MRKKNTIQTDDLSILLCNLEFKSQLRKLEHENADLRFLNTQYIHRLRSLEKESRQKDNKILELQEKNFQAVVQTPGTAQSTAILEKTHWHIFFFRWK